jgi:hypothetical protein
MHADWPDASTMVARAQPDPLCPFDSLEETDAD